MRQIKFRAKSESSGKWIYGHYYNNHEYGVNQNIIVTDPDGNSGQHYIVDGRTLGQFTGLKDKGGKPIYEGDIVRLKYGEDVKIFFNESMASWDYEYAGGDCEPIIPDGSYYEPTGFEVIGNVFDNPELWEVEE